MIGFTNMLDVVRAGKGTQADPWVGWHDQQFASGRSYHFPSGWYRFPTKLNLGGNNIQVTGEDDTHLVFTGAGNALEVDALTGYYSGIFLNNLRIHGNANCTNGISLRNIGGIKLRNITVRDVSAAGIKLDFCVIGVLDRVSVAPAGVAFSPTPVNGILITGQVGGLKSTNISLIAPDCNGCSGSAIKFDQAAFCEVLTGSGEGSGRGFELTTNSYGIHLDSTISEGDSIEDVLVDGVDAMLTNCETIGMLRVGGNALRAELHGGEYASIQIDSGASSTKLRGLAFGYNSGTLVDNGTNTFVENVMHAGTGQLYGLHSIAGDLRYRSLAGTTTVLAPA